MTSGLIFDIKEFAVHDGPGIRTTVFFKGCPLKCTWCHNPEGLSFKEEIMVSVAACIKCGKCIEVCKNQCNSDLCDVCGDCVNVCPVNIRKISGKRFESIELAEKLLKNKEFLEKNGGGITISGGEPLSQPEFLLDLLSDLKPLHRIIQTSGYAKLDIFKKVVESVDMILFDIKHTNSDIHLKYTGIENDLILKNLDYLCKSNCKFILRLPLIPCVNDSKENMEKIAELVKDAKNLVEINFLPYHKTAGAKYSMVNKQYKPNFNENKEPMLFQDVFDKIGIKCKKL